MTELRVTGDLSGLPVQGAWIDGALTGTPVYIAMLRDLAQRGSVVRIPGIVECDATLAAGARPVEVAATMLADLDTKSARIVSDVPIANSLPEGTIA